jgi:methionine transaminase
MKNEVLEQTVSISTKLPGVSTSIFAVMSGLANQHNAINLSQGFPDFNPPERLLKLMNKYMREGKNQYAPMPGILSLREKLAAKFSKLYGANYDPEKEITITAGATQAIYTIISTVVGEEDEVIIFEPAYDSYSPSVILNKGVPKFMQLKPPFYSIDWEEVKKLVTYKTKLIIINTPHNPTGSVLTPADMVALEKLVSNTDIFILSDEVYEHIIFDGLQHESICKYPELMKRSFVVFSFGKTYHNTGWKTGYVLAPENLTAEFRKIYQFLMFSCLTPAQYAYADFLDDEEHYLSLNAFYQVKRDLFASFIKDSKFKPVPCKGTYFQCLDFTAISDEKDTAFAERLTTEHKIASIPVSVFYHKKTDHKVLRFCFAKSEETLKRAGEILCRT